MFRAVANVRDEVLRRCGNGEITLGHVTAAFKQVTAIDEIVYAPYDVPKTNPIIGQFSRYTKSPGVYVPSKTLVEIQYASHLDEAWRRMVVCKELCHALEAPEGVHSASNEGIDKLVEGFALLSSASDLKDHLKDDGGALGLEFMAEFGALEILFPLPRRKQLFEEGMTPDQTKIMGLAAAYKIPPVYVVTALGKDYTRMTELLMRAP